MTSDNSNNSSIKYSLSDSTAINTSYITIMSKYSSSFDNDDAHNLKFQVSEYDIDAINNDIVNIFYTVGDQDNY